MNSGILLDWSGYKLKPRFVNGEVYNYFFVIRGERLLYP